MLVFRQNWNILLDFINIEYSELNRTVYQEHAKYWRTQYVEYI